MTRFEKRKDAEVRAVHGRVGGVRRCAATKPSAGLQPPLLARETVRLNPIGGVQLADCFGQVIAHRAMREAQLRRYIC